MLRQLERWLHQHIFKVGWLVTKQLQTTTILYYAFFLPGIVLNQVSYWLMAGLLNVRADRAIQWPQKQEIGELKLNFVKLARNTGQVRLAIIALTPFVTAIAVVWVVANHVFNIQEIAVIMRSGFLDDITSAVNRLTVTPDFWIWVYLLFVVSNTMMPDWGQLRGWRVIGAVLGVILAALLIIGAGDEVLFTLLNGPVRDGLNVLAGTFAVIIGVDLFMVAVLGTLEALIERITGDSVTFKNGKMVAMRRSEMLAQQAQQPRARTTREPRVSGAAGPPSVYRLPFPIPEAPGKEVVSRTEGVIIKPESQPARPLTPQPTTPARIEPSVVSGSTAVRPPTASGTAPPPRPSPPTQPGLPPPAPPRPRQPAHGELTNGEDESEDDAGELRYEDTEDSA